MSRNFLLCYVDTSYLSMFGMSDYLRKTDSFCSCRTSPTFFLTEAALHKIGEKFLWLFLKSPHLFKNVQDH